MLAGSIKQKILASNNNPGYCYVKMRQICHFAENNLQKAEEQCIDLIDRSRLPQAGISQSYESSSNTASYPLDIAADAGVSRANRFACNSQRPFCG
jgi:hypothetical protein